MEQHTRQDTQRKEVFLDKGSNDDGLVSKRSKKRGALYKK